MKNCGKNEAKINRTTSVSITKLQKQASISLNNGAWPNPRSGNLRLLLNPLAARGVDKSCSRLRWGNSSSFASLFIFHKYFFHHNALVIHNARHTQEVDTWGWKCLCGRWTTTAGTWQSVSLISEKDRKEQDTVEDSPVKGNNQAY